MPTVSHWQADVPASAEVAPLPDRCDVAVIGGGIAGVSTAYWLRQFAPDLDVVIVERGRLASGASGRNAGFLLQGTDADFARTVEERGVETARRVWRFTEENRDGLVAAVADADVGLAYSGSVTVAGDEEEDARLRTAEALLRSEGVDVSYWSAAETNRRFGSTGFLGALYIARGAMMHPVRVVLALAARSAAHLAEGQAVESLEPDGDRVRIGTNSGYVHADRAVLALNAYLPMLVPALAPLVEPFRAQMLATAPVTRRLDYPIYSHQGYYYLRQLPSGEVLLGGARHRHRDAEVGYDDATTEPLQSDLETYLRDHFPDLAGAAVQRRWSGTMGFSADGLPAVGPVPGLPRALWVGGFTGHGMGYGFRMGRLAAAMLLGQSDPYEDLFHTRRFERTGQR